MRTIKTYSRADFPTEVFLQLTEKIYGSQRPDKLPKPNNLRGVSYFLIENEQALASATVYSNPEVKDDEKSLLMIGNFEALEVDCKELFGAIEMDARRAGTDKLIGPINGSTWQEHRFIVDQFGAPFLSEMTHPNYYSQLWKQNEFETDQTYFSYKDTAISANDERIVKMERHFSDLNIRLRTIDLANFEAELEQIYALCMLAFSSNVLYSEISKEQFIASYLPLQSMLNEEYIWIAENQQNECLGFLFAFENKLNATENELIVKTIAKHPSFRYNGLGTLLGNQFMKKAIENDITSIIHAFMHQNNTSKNLSQHFNGECIRSYELLSKKLSK